MVTQCGVVSEAAVVCQSPVRRLSPARMPLELGSEFGGCVVGVDGRAMTQPQCVAIASESPLVSLGVVPDCVEFKWQWGRESVGKYCSGNSRLMVLE